MTPTRNATPAQLRHDATLAEQIAKRYPFLQSDMLAMAARRRALATTLDAGGEPHTQA